MKILHVVHGYTPSIGGAQWLVQRLSEELVSRHHDQVTVFTTVARNMEHFVADDGAALPVGIETINGVTVRRFPVFNRLTRQRMLLASLSYRFRLPGNEYCRSLLNGPIVFSLRRAIAGSGAEVVMAASFPLLHMYDALYGARRAGVPAVLLGALHVEDRWNFDRRMIFRAMRRADAYIALTRFEADHVIARGVPAERVRVIGGGVDSDRFAAARGATVRQQYGLGDAPVVASIAKHVERKRFDIVLAALQQVWQTHPQVRLLIAGGPTPYTTTLEEMISRIPPQQRTNVILVSGFAEKDKPDLLAACDIFVLASVRDSFGLVFPEAWACHRPVIGIDAGAIASVIDHGSDGLLVPYEDATTLAGAIVRLLEDSELRQRMGENGYRKVQQRYTWPIISNNLRELYLQVLERRAGRQA